MYFLEKNNKTPLGDLHKESLPRLTERFQNKLSFKFQKQLQKDKQKHQHRYDILTQKKQNMNRKYCLNNSQLSKTKENQLKNCRQNLIPLNRTLDIRNHQNSLMLNLRNDLLLSNIEKSQIKYNKVKKQDWMAIHKRVSTNFTKFNDNEQRIIYRSRKKYFQNSLSTFNIFQEKTKCFQGIFPMSRLNSMMINLFDKYMGKQRLFLIGGLSSQMSTNFHFHQYHFLQQRWEKVDYELSNSPQFNLSQHLVLSYQNSIFILGGIAVFPLSNQLRNQRYNIPFISCYNLKTHQWKRINWSIYLRAHAGAVYGHFGILDGGITQQDKPNTKTFLIDLTKMQSPVLVNFNGLGLSHHKIISTQAFQDKNRSILKLDGLMCFGGKRSNGELNKNLYIMNYDPKCTELNDKFNKFQWSLVQTSGKCPESRYMHSMDLLETKSSIFERKAYCAVLGGIDKNEQILKDFWLFDLNSLQWTQIILQNNECLLLQNGIAGHCSTSVKNQVYIFGGYNKDRYNISKFWAINCENNFHLSKKQGKTVSRQHPNQKKPRLSKNTQNQYDEQQRQNTNLNGKPNQATLVKSKSNNVQFDLKQEQPTYNQQVTK